MRIKGKTVIVTGAARGIGRGLAEAYADAGAKVIVADLGSLAARPGADWLYALSPKSQLDAAASAIRERSGQCLAVEVDVTERASCQNLVDETVKVFGSLDILVNNAGLIQSGPTVEFAEADWERIFAVNVKGIFLMSQAALPQLTKNGGVIINMASVAGKRGFPKMAAYCASKFAAIGLTQSLAAELAEHEIRVNAICPGHVATAMWNDHLSQALRRPDSEDDTMTAIIRESVPLKREQSAQDIAEAALYLTRADHVTGVALSVSGGFVMD